MNNWKTILYTGLILLAGTKGLYGQQANAIDMRWKEFIDVNKYMEPFWKADTIYDEIVQLIQDKGPAEGSLLFAAKQVLSVRSANLGTTFEENKDWKYAQGKIMIVPGSKIPFFKKEELVFTTEKAGRSMKGKNKGEFVPFSEDNYFRSMQISVTYIPLKEKKWNGPVPVFARAVLPLSIGKLNGKKDFKVVFFGNSIETGANSSGYQNESPYMPSWPELIIGNLRRNYRGAIGFNNQSVGGMLAQWGQDKAAELVGQQKPDLVIIGFGMNDGSAKIPPEKYRQNIKSIMDSVLLSNPSAEFILIAPMLANPFAIQSGIQASYKSELDKLAKKGVAVADLTGVHRELLNHKSYQDMTGNNVNHPNDYLARWYAQFISGMLVPE